MSYHFWVIGDELLIVRNGWLGMSYNWRVLSDGWKIDERRLTAVCDIQLVMGNQLLVWSEKRLVLGNGWSMVSDRFIGNELLVNVDLSLVIDEWYQMGDGDVGRMINKCRWYIIHCWQFIGDIWRWWGCWVMSDWRSIYRSQIIDEGWWIFVSRVKGTDHHIGQWWTIVDCWWLIKNE